MTNERPIVESRLVDHFLEVGIAADTLARLTVYGKLEVRIAKGRIEITESGEPTVFWVGTQFVEPSASDWTTAADYIKGKKVMA